MLMFINRPVWIFFSSWFRTLVSFWPYEMQAGHPLQGVTDPDDNRLPLSSSWEIFLSSEGHYRFPRKNPNSRQPLCIIFLYAPYPLKCFLSPFLAPVFAFWNWEKPLHLPRKFDGTIIFTLPFSSILLYLPLSTFLLPLPPPFILSSTSLLLLPPFSSFVLLSPSNFLFLLFLPQIFFFLLPFAEQITCES